MIIIKQCKPEFFISQFSIIFDAVHPRQHTLAKSLETLWFSATSLCNK